MSSVLTAGPARMDGLPCQATVIKDKTTLGQYACLTTKELLSSVNRPAMRAKTLDNIVDHATMVSDSRKKQEPICKLPPNGKNQINMEMKLQKTQETVLLGKYFNLRTEDCSKIFPVLEEVNFSNVMFLCSASC